MVKDVMDTKVLLRLIKDDIKILENINDSFINQTNLTCEEAEVALARSRALVMEFEMLSKNLSREEEPQLFGEQKPDKKEAETEKKFRSLRNFLPFITSEEKSAAPATDHPENFKDGMTDSAEEVLPFEEPDSIRENYIVNEIAKDSKNSLPGKGNGEAVIDSTPLIQTEAPLIEIAEETDKPDSAPVTEILEKPDGEKKTFVEVAGEKQQNVNDLLLQDRTEVRFETKPLKSIRDGIGINDRFLFIRELFHHNSEKYDQTLTALDELTGIEDAVRFLKQNFKWSKSEAGEKFLLLIKRRFTK